MHRSHISSTAKIKLPPLQSCVNHCLGFLIHTNTAPVSILHWEWIMCSLSLTQKLLTNCDKIKHTNWHRVFNWEVTMFIFTFHLGRVLHHRLKRRGAWGTIPTIKWHLNNRRIQEWREGFTCQMIFFDSRFLALSEIEDHLRRKRQTGRVADCFTATPCVSHTNIWEQVHFLSLTSEHQLKSCQYSDFVCLHRLAVTDA